MTMADVTQPLADCLSENASVDDLEVKVSQSDSLNRQIRILNKMKGKKRDDNKLYIATISTADQSEISALSSCDSNESSVGNATFLFDTLGYQNIEAKKSRRTKRKDTQDEKFSPISFNRIFLKVYNSVFDDTLKSNCVEDFDTVIETAPVIFVQSDHNADPMLSESARRAEERTDSFKPDDSHTSSNQTMFISYENDIPTISPLTIGSRKHAEKANVVNCEPLYINSARKSGVYRVPLNDTVPNTTPGYFAWSSPRRFMSTSLSVDESASSIVASDDEAEPSHDLLNVAEKREGKSTGPLSTAAEALAIVERSLFDTLSFETQIESYSDSESISSQSNKGESSNHAEEDPMDKTSLFRSSAPLVTQRNDLVTEKAEAIEVDDIGNIMSEHVNGNRLHSLDRNIYLSYSIEPQQSKVHEERSDTSDSRDGSVHTPKNNSILKSFSVPKWKRRLRLFSGSKEKKEDSYLDTKIRRNVCDSPGATTTSTIPTDGSSFEDEEFFNRTAPYLIRPRTRQHYRIDTAPAFDTI